MFSEAGRDIGCYGLDPNDHHLSKTCIFIEQKYAFFSGWKRTWSIGSQTISPNCHLQKTKCLPHEIKCLFSQEENRKHWPLWIGSWTILSSSRQTFTGEPSLQAILLMTRPGTEDQVTFRIFPFDAIYIFWHSAQCWAWNQFNTWWNIIRFNHTKESVPTHSLVQSLKKYNFFATFSLKAQMIDTFTLQLITQC